jgi:hypothetical protein
MIVVFNMVSPFLKNPASYIGVSAKKAKTIANRWK